jgi:hypothetical protein
MYELLVNEYPYTVKDVAITTFSTILVTLAIIFYSRAMQCGIAGTV